MSDDEAFFDGSGEEFEFDYNSDEEPTADVSLENEYYSAKSTRSNVDEAFVAFRGVIDMEEGKGEYGFKSLKQLVKLCLKNDRGSDAVTFYKEFLTYQNAVAKAMFEASINRLLDLAASVNDLKTAESLYSLTLSTLNSADNERLMIKTNLRLGKAWLLNKKFSELSELLKTLHSHCKEQDNEGIYTIEVCALEIQLCTETGNMSRLKELYHHTTSITSAVSHPRIMGVIRECGGKMHMNEQNWAQAQKDFFESFKNYDEAASEQRIQVLRYFVLTNMLSKSDIDPFETQETKPLRSHEAIQVMTNLSQAYQQGRIDEFERIVNENEHDLMGDSFIKQHLSSVLQDVRTRNLMHKLEPYSTLSMERIAYILSLNMGQVRELVISLILDGHIKGRLNMTKNCLEMDEPEDKWVTELHRLQVERNAFWRDNES